MALYISDSDGKLKRIAGGGVTITEGGDPSADYLELKNKVTTLEQNINSLNSSKQDTLISGTNIKTINGNTLLGEGNIEISNSSGNKTTFRRWE